MVQKIPSRQTFTTILNRRCDLDLERFNRIFSQATQASDAVLSNQVRLRTSTLEDIVEMVIFYNISPRCDLDIEDRDPIFLHDTPSRDDKSPNQVWFKKEKEKKMNS